MFKLMDPSIVGSVMRPTNLFVVLKIWVRLVRTQTLPHRAAPSAPQVWRVFGLLRQLRHSAASPSRVSAFLLPKHAVSAANEIGAASLAPPQLWRGMHRLPTKRTHSSEASASTLQGSLPFAFLIKILKNANADTLILGTITF